MLLWCSCTLVCKTGKPKLATPKGHFMHQKCQKNPKIFFQDFLIISSHVFLIKFKTDLKVTPLNNLGQGFDSPFHQKIKFNDQLYSTPFSWLLKKWWMVTVRLTNSGNQIIHFWMNNCLVWTLLWLFFEIGSNFLDFWRSLVCMLCSKSLKSLGLLNALWKVRRG